MPETSAPRARASRSDELSLSRRFEAVRQATQALAAPLTAEDCAAQSMADASPVKWHLGHTTWFFETFVLANDPTYRAFDEDYSEIFNSYYNAIGPQLPRAARGLLTRPTLDEIGAYRSAVDVEIAARLSSGGLSGDEQALLELGLNHEQQHQELILTDVKHLLSQNPRLPAYRKRWPLGGISPINPEWVRIAGGLYEVGAEGEDFHFDNEGPRHKVWIDEFEISSLLVTNGDFINFIDDRGYERPELWLDAGWAAVQRLQWRAPLYWRRAEAGWRCFTLHGDVAIDPNAPVCHISFYEADAFARWSKARLATESEWEIVAQGARVAGNFCESGALHPVALRAPIHRGEVGQLFGDVWEWTRSDYSPYPGFAPSSGAVGEYNGKFMSGQYVLRGGSAASPQNHLRASYRNFFPPETRWQFSGVRLARDTRKNARRAVAPNAAAATFLADRGLPRSDADEIARGLLKASASIAPKYFYDQIGSQLFEAITRLPEYYLPRAESEILRDNGPEIAALVREELGDEYQIVEPGAGGCEKIEALLPVFKPAGYIALDISASFLETAVERLQSKFPTIPMTGVGMDHSCELALPEELRRRPTLVFYPGSSLGNFCPDRARQFLVGARAISPKSMILLGVDLIKDREVLEAAYNDAIGVTAAFNRNVLQHINRLLGADFDPADWRHISFFNEAFSRIEMHLEAKHKLTAHWPGGERRFAEGERILTEYSYKWSKDGVVAMLQEAGFAQTRLWSDSQGRFAVALGASRTRSGGEIGPTDD